MNRVRLVCPCSLSRSLEKWSTIRLELGFSFRFQHFTKLPLSSLGLRCWHCYIYWPLSMNPSLTLRDLRSAVSRRELGSRVKAPHSHSRNGAHLIPEITVWKPIYVCIWIETCNLRDAGIGHSLSRSEDICNGLQKVGSNHKCSKRKQSATIT
jgi:hypothetical protein